MPRGGKRPGAGRPKGIPNKTTTEQRATISDMAKEHTEAALRVLVEVASDRMAGAARVTAAIALLDRGWGKPPQALTHSGPDGGPIRTVQELTDDELLAIILAGSEGAADEEEGPGKPDRVRQVH